MGNWAGNSILVFCFLIKNENWFCHWKISKIQEMCRKNYEKYIDTPQMSIESFCEFSPRSEGRTTASWWNLTRFFDWLLRIYGNSRILTRKRVLNKSKTFAQYTSLAPTLHTKIFQMVLCFEDNEFRSLPHTCSEIQTKWISISYSSRSRRFLWDHKNIKK